MEGVRDDRGHDLRGELGELGHEDACEGHAVGLLVGREGPPDPAGA